MYASLIWSPSLDLFIYLTNVYSHPSQQIILGSEQWLKIKMDTYTVQKIKIHSSQENYNNQLPGQEPHPSSHSGPQAWVQNEVFRVLQKASGIRDNLISRGKMFHRAGSRAHLLGPIQLMFFTWWDPEDVHFAGPDIMYGYNMPWKVFKVTISTLNYTWRYTNSQ